MLLSNGESIVDSSLAALFGIAWHRPAPEYNRAGPHAVTDVLHIQT
jgi:hypothetical protein